MQEKRTEEYTTTEIRRECDGADEYREKLRERGYKLRGYADSMLDNVVIRETDGKHLTLVKVTPEDLGLPEGGAGGEIHEAAKRKGLEPCPAWVAPQYRLDCADDENTVVGTDPVPSSDGHPGIFCVNRDDSTRWFCGYGARAHWHQDSAWVFVLRK